MHVCMHTYTLYTLSLYNYSMQTLKKEKEDLTKERDEQLDEISAVR